MSEITTKSIYELKEHESTEVLNSANGDRMWIVTRVPGGWIYIHMLSSGTGVFIPDNRTEHPPGIR